MTQATHWQVIDRHTYTYASRTLEPRLNEPTLGFVLKMGLTARKVCHKLIVCKQARPKGGLSSNIYREPLVLWVSKLPKGIGACAS